MRFKSRKLYGTATRSNSVGPSGKIWGFESFFWWIVTVFEFDEKERLIFE